MNNKYQSLKLMFVALYVFDMLLLLSCVVRPKKFKEQNFKAIQLISSLPVFTSEDKLVNADDTLTLFYEGDFRLFQIPSLNSSVKTTLNKEGNTIKEEIESIDLNYKYFLFRKGDRYGVMYDSIGAQTGNQLLVDSFMAMNTITNFSPFFKNISKDDSLVESVWLNDKTLLEKYIPKSKLDASYNDSTYLYLRKDLQDIEFSFSKEFDSTKNMKLSQIRLIYNNNPGSNDHFGKLAKEINFELIKISAINKKKILNFLRRCERKQKD